MNLHDTCDDNDESDTDKDLGPDGESEFFHLGDQDSIHCQAQCPREAAASRWLKEAKVAALPINVENAMLESLDEYFLSCPVEAPTYLHEFQEVFVVGPEVFPFVASNACFHNYPHVFGQPHRDWLREYIVLSVCKVECRVTVFREAGIALHTVDSLLDTALGSHCQQPSCTPSNPCDDPTCVQAGDAVKAYLCLRSYFPDAIRADRRHLQHGFEDSWAYYECRYKTVNSS